MAEAALKQDQNGGTKLSPEEALAKAQAAIKERDDKLALADAENARLRNENAQNAERATNLATARVTDEERTISSQMEAATARVDSATREWRAAREAGDIDAEQKANIALADAIGDKKYWNLQSEQFKNTKDRQLADAKAPVGGANAGPDPDVRTWMQNRPRFQPGKDAQYRSDALAAHAAWLAQGHRPVGTAYTNYLDQQLERLHGKNHITGEKEETGQQRRGSGAGDAAPPGRDDATTFSKHGLRLSVGADGKDRLDGDIPVEWQEYAKISKMTPIEYAISKLKIERENTQETRPEGIIYR